MVVRCSDVILMLSGRAWRLLFYFCSLESLVGRGVELRYCSDTFTRDCK